MRYAYAMEQENQTPPDYDFIVGDPSQTPPDTNKKKRLIIAIAGGSLILLFFGIAFALIINSGRNIPTSTEQFIKITQTQEEIVRISTVATRNARTQSTRNIAATIIRSINSSKQSVAARLASQDVPISNATLRAGQNPNTTKELDDAIQANQFDQVYLRIVTDQLTSYQKLLETTFENAKIKAERELLQQLYIDASALLRQLEN